MPSRDEKLKNAEKRKAELQAEAKKIHAAIPTAPSKAKTPLERAQRVVHRLIGKVRGRIDDLRAGTKVMFDSIDLSQFPGLPPAVAGYVGGNWPTFKALVQKFPHAKHLSIAVNSGEDAECLDIETGDATPAEAPAWVHRQIARGVDRPAVYGSVSNMALILSTLATGGINRKHVRVWTAHYTEKPHLCGPECGYGLKTRADATQFTDHALGRNLDQSKLKSNFF